MEPVVIDDSSGMAEPRSPELEREMQKLRDMAEQLRAALAVLKERIDASTTEPPPEPTLEALPKPAPEDHAESPAPSEPKSPSGPE